MIAPLIAGLAFFAVLLATVKPLGIYMDDVFAGRKTFLSPLLVPVERVVYRILPDRRAERDVVATYTFALLALSAASLVTLYAGLRLQAFLPLNPQHFPGLAPDLAWNTAASFATTTDWQFYSGENTMSYFSQMAFLAWQNFIAAAVGLTVVIALARGLARQKSGTVGNFWVDLTRSLLYVLLPLSFVFSIAFVAEGMPQNLRAYLDVRTWTAQCRRLPVARWHRKRASSFSAATAADSSAPIRVRRTRTRRRSRTFCNCSRCFSSRRRSPTRSGG